jgi:hypothetical protein
MVEEPKRQRNLLSKVLGYCIVVGAAGAKAPQILRILRAGNAAGMSLLMPLMEVAACELATAQHTRKYLASCTTELCAHAPLPQTRQPSATMLRRSTH